MTLRSFRVHDAVLLRELRSSRSMRQALQPLAARATRAGKQVANERVSRQTGRYANSFSSRVVNGHGGEIARIELSNSAPYAKYIEVGTRPHVMPKKATVYAWESDSGTLIANYGPIKHPGTTAQRVIEVALKRVVGGGLY